MASTKPPEEEVEEEEDYMTMAIPDVPNKPETSLRRRQRLHREGLARGRVPSKAEVAAEAEARRERGLATSLLTNKDGSLTTTTTAPAKSKGLAMMAKMGFRGGALGAKHRGRDEDEDDEGGARTEPLRIAIKDDRAGIGMESERKRRLREAAEAAEARTKRARADEGEYRERVRREREEARRERQVAAAQKVAERMDEEREVAASGKEGDVDPPDGTEEKARGKTSVRNVSSRPLKSINVLWRGLVRAREEAERDRRMRYDLEQSLSRLPTYNDEDEDEDDRKALGKTRTVYETADDLDEEDPELDEFNGLDVEERLQRVVAYLRKEYRYCFWCKFTYPDESMEGCPGVTEEDHD